MLSQIASWVSSCVGAFRSRVVLIDIVVRAIRYLRCHRHESSQRLARKAYTNILDTTHHIYTNALLMRPRNRRFGFPRYSAYFSQLAILANHKRRSFCLLFAACLTWCLAYWWCVCSLLPECKESRNACSPSALFPLTLLLGQYNPLKRMWSFPSSWDAEFDTSSTLVRVCWVA
mgnify:CR=1 FL=1